MTFPYQGSDQACLIFFYVCLIFSMFVDLFISDKVDCVSKNFGSNGTNNNASSLSNIVYCIGSAANQKEFSPIIILLTTVTLIVKP